ncbi:hypothetical protein C8J56DRAFT_930586 [Mycena floridula]|nr:hypothetical protein C8J56DRAFT_930586 [Mycena floridula]
MPFRPTLAFVTDLSLLDLCHVMTYAHTDPLVEIVPLIGTTYLPRLRRSILPVTFVKNSFLRLVQMIESWQTTSSPIAEIWCSRPHTTITCQTPAELDRIHAAGARVFINANPSVILAERIIEGIGVHTHSALVNFSFPPSKYHQTSIQCLQRRPWTHSHHFLLSSFRGYVEM